MNDATGRRRDVRRLIWIAVAIVAALVIVLLLVAWLIAASVLRMMDRTDAHVCGLAAVRHSPIAVRLVGLPIEQRGFTGGSTSSENGELTENLRFTVGGPRGTAYVASEGRRSPLESHLIVRIGREGRSETIYSGPFDCAELHARPR
jgi:hypothetical protein